MLLKKKKKNDLGHNIGFKKKKKQYKQLLKLPYYRLGSDFLITKIKKYFFLILKWWSCWKNIL